MEHYRSSSHSRYDIKYHFVTSSGNVTDEVILEYIRLQDQDSPMDGGENFGVVIGE
jgi:REP element-mobilizing transposase RayT